MAKDKGTAVDLTPPNSHGVTDAEAAAFDLQPHLINLMWDEPFYSKVLRGITKKREDSIPTAGVMVRDGYVTMVWNPHFLASLVKEGKDKIKGLAIHECLHLVFEHCTERKHDPHIIWNYATDCAINSLIPRDFLPNCGIIPGEAFTELTAEQKEKMSPDGMERYQRMSDFIEALPKGLSSEEYFALFMQNEDIKKDLEDQAKGGQGEPGDGMPGPMDDHDGWGEMTEEEKELVKGKIKQAITDAAKECDAKGSWGSVSGEARSMIRAMISKEVPWQQLLKKFCGMTRRADRRSSRRRLNKKYPGIHSGFKRSYTASIAVYIDQSGSVGNDELELLFGELANLANRIEFTTFHFDTEVDLESETVWRSGKIPAPHRTRCGGTCFKAPSKHAEKNKHKFDGYMILTDGYAANPGPSRLRRAWIITPDGTTEPWMKGAKQSVIAISHKALDKAA
jgi:predicted metal-dependent peptidase